MSSGRVVLIPWIALAQVLTAVRIAAYEYHDGHAGWRVIFD